MENFLLSRSILSLGPAYTMAGADGAVTGGVFEAARDSNTVNTAFWNCCHTRQGCGWVNSMVLKALEAQWVIWGTGKVRHSMHGTRSGTG